MAAPLLYGGVAALNLVGGYFASENIKESARLNQDISEMNAQFAELDAYDAEIEGFTQEARYQSVIDTTLSDPLASSSFIIRLNKLVGSLVSWSTAATNAWLHSPSLAASRTRSEARSG